MSGQANREPEDPARKPREYVRRLAIAAATAGGVGLLAVYNLAVAGIHMREMFYELSQMRLGAFGNGFDEWANYGIGTILLCSAGGLILCCFCRDRVRKLQSLPYVPPVHEQLTSLPAEVLLRSSDEPGATPEELLRAARPGAADPAEELLRAGDIRVAQDQPAETAIQQGATQ